MKRIIKTPSEKYYELKNADNVFNVEHGAIKYDKGNTIIYDDDELEIRTYRDYVPEDTTLSQFIDEFIDNGHDAPVSKFIEWFDENNDEKRIKDEYSEMNSCWFEHVCDYCTPDDVKQMDFEYEEFDALKLLNEFKDSIRGHDFEWIKSHYTVSCDYQSDDIYFVSYDSSLKFIIKVYNGNNTITVHNVISVMDDKYIFKCVYVDGASDEVTYNAKGVNMVDDSVLALTAEQKTSLELLKIAIKSAHDTGLKIFNTPEMGTFAFNGNKLKCNVAKSFNENNFLFKKDSPLKTTIPWFGDEYDDSVIWQYFGDENEELGLCVNDKQ